MSIGTSQRNKAVCSILPVALSVILSCNRAKSLPSACVRHALAPHRNDDEARAQLGASGSAEAWSAAPLLSQTEGDFKPPCV